MKIFFTIVFLFISLIAVAIGYDQIVPRMSKAIKKPAFHICLLILLSAWMSSDDWWTIFHEPGLQSLENYRQLGRSGLVLATLYTIAFVIYYFARNAATVGEHTKHERRICTSCLKVLDPLRVNTQHCSKSSGPTEVSPHTVHTVILTSKVEKEYLWLGVTFGIFIVVSVTWQPNLMSFFLLALAIPYVFRTPYRIDLLDDQSIIVYGIRGKKIVPQKNILKTHDNIHSFIIQHSGGFIHPSSLSSNLTQLGNALQRHENSVSINQQDEVLAIVPGTVFREEQKPQAKIDRSEDNFDIMIRSILTALFSIVFPILAILVFIGWVQKALR